MRSRRQRCSWPARIPPADLSKATDQAADAIPDAQIRVLEGHAHMAHKTDPAMVAGLIRQFISS